MSTAASSPPVPLMASSTDTSGITTVLTQEKLSAASDLLVLDGEGNEVRFGSLYESQKCIVVFIRHFFCGVSHSCSYASVVQPNVKLPLQSCQQYVSQLTSVEPKALEQSSIKVVIIGCGDWLLVNNYKEMTCNKSHASIFYYADPSRTVYKALGMTTETLQRTPGHEKRKSYLQQSYATNLFGSIFRALKSPLHLGKQGNVSQLGGEFIIGPKNACSYAHYMQHTEDHAEVSDLFREAGVTFS